VPSKDKALKNKTLSPIRRLLRGWGEATTERGGVLKGGAHWRGNFGRRAKGLEKSAQRGSSVEENLLPGGSKNRVRCNGIWGKKGFGVDWYAEKRLTSKKRE